MAHDPTELFHAFEQAGWSDAGLADAYDRHMSLITRQSIPALLDAVGAGPGERVLDVATGAGYVAAAAAARGAAATGLDFAPAQLELARRSHPEVHFQCGDAQALPFQDGSFDGVACAFGMCHFPQPARALAEAHRVLRPGGRVAFTVWDALQNCAGLEALYGAIREHGALDVGLPEGPNFFLYSDPLRCVAELENAGFRQVSVRPVPQVWRLARADELLDVVASATVRAAALWKRQSAEAQAAIRAAVRQKIARFERGGVFEVPMPALLACAVKP